jgi:DNA polymerase-3 subunit epsilon
MQPMAFVDLETTGATATVDRITEIGIAAVDEAGVQEWSQLVNPEVSIPGFIQNMTGISDAMVRNAPTFERLADEILERLDGRLLIAHNARFDYGFLKSEFRRIGYDFRATVLCTVKLSRRLFPEHRRHGLDALIERHGLPAEDRHRALADARLIHQFWQLLRNTLPGDRLFSLVRELTARPGLPAHLDSGNVDELPEAPGVYLFYGENAMSLYVGKAKDIRTRVLSHFAGDNASAKEMSIVQQLKRIEWIVTSGEIGALLREAALVGELQPIYNRQLGRNAELCAIVLIDHGGGLVKPEVISAHDLDFGQQADLFGPFKTAKDAKTLLTEVGLVHGLCHSLLGLEKVNTGKPCFARQIGKCRGACVGAELPVAHTLRLVQALSRLRMTNWPFPGPACIKEGEEAHVVDAWRYLGSAKSDDEIRALLDQARPRFDLEIYRILVKAADRLVPLGPVTLRP